jgi:hypothetical protein
MMLTQGLKLGGKLCSEFNDLKEKQQSVRGGSHTIDRLQNNIIIECQITTEAVSNNVSCI